MKSLALISALLTMSIGPMNGQLTTEYYTKDLDMPTTTATASSRNIRCVNDPSISQKEYDDHHSVLESEFSPNGDYKRPLDLAFIVDRSESIGDISLQQTRESINALISKLSELRYIFIHRNYTRVAIISFAAHTTVEFDGISKGSDAIDACSVSDRVSGLRVNESLIGQSRLAEAISRAQQLFKLSKRDDYRKDPLQILWMFYDGECVLDKCAEYKYEGKTISGWANSLRETEVRIFTSGVGQWLNTEEKENRIKALANGVNHYACASAWMKIISKLKSKNSGETPTSLYSEITTDKASKCGSCPENFQCACEVNSRNYSCTDQKLEPIVPTTIVIKVPVTGEPVVETPFWVYPVVIGCGVIGGILLLVLLITLPLMSARRRQEREEEKKFFENQPIYGGPPLPPPPVKRTQRSDILPMQTRDNIYANPEAVRNAAEETSFEDPSMELSNEYMAIPYPQSYVNAEMELEHNMKEWPGHLAGLKNSNHLEYLAVRSIPTDNWAKTADCPLEEKDFREMEKVMRNFKKNLNLKLKLAGKTYNVDKSKSGNVQLRATRKVQSGMNEFAWVSKVYDYVTVGVAMDNNDCLRAVTEIHQHLVHMIESNPNHLSTGEPESIYSNFIEMSPYTPGY